MKVNQILGTLALGAGAIFVKHVYFTPQSPKKSTSSNTFSRRKPDFLLSSDQLRLKPGYYTYDGSPTKLEGITAPTDIQLQGRVKWGSNRIAIETDQDKTWLKDHGINQDNRTEFFTSLKDKQGNLAWLAPEVGDDFELQSPGRKRVVIPEGIWIDYEDDAKFPLDADEIQVWCQAQKQHDDKYLNKDNWKVQIQSGVVKSEINKWRSNKKLSSLYSEYVPPQLEKKKKS